jgi:nitrate reductase gamma subunit
MEQWLEWARGPAFRLSLVLLVLGVLRLVLINFISMARLVWEAKRNETSGLYRDWPDAPDYLSEQTKNNHLSLSFKQIFISTLKWLLPIGKGIELRPMFTLVSMLFHISIIVTPLFLAAHIMLWDRGLGISWAALGFEAADILTLIAISTSLILFCIRIVRRDARSLSRLQDYAFPLLIAVPFITGYLAMHPAINPFSYNGAMFVHVMSANLILLLIPFSKIAHAVLFPVTQLISEVGWFLKIDSGEKVMQILGKEKEPI